MALYKVTRLPNKVGRSSDSVYFRIIVPFKFLNKKRKQKDQGTRQENYDCRKIDGKILLFIFNFVIKL